jgi:hypothetical protein
MINAAAVVSLVLAAALVVVAFDTWHHLPESRKMLFRTPFVSGMISLTPRRISVETSLTKQNDFFAEADWARRYKTWRHRTLGVLLVSQDTIDIDDDDTFVGVSSGRRLGFGYDHGLHGTPGTPLVSNVPSYWRILVPSWFAAAVLLTPLAIVFFRYNRRRKRIRHGLCPTCRYDLTGNVSGVCPECGTAVNGM